MAKELYLYGKRDLLTGIPARKEAGTTCPGAARGRGEHEIPGGLIPVPILG